MASNEQFEAEDNATHETARLDALGFREALAEAVRAATQRAGELGLAARRAAAEPTEES
jgi:hypothetical protein